MRNDRTAGKGQCFAQLANETDRDVYPHHSLSWGLQVKTLVMDSFVMIECLSCPVLSVQGVDLSSMRFWLFVYEHRYCQVLQGNGRDP
jgi:hypothetical protein